MKNCEVKSGIQVVILKIKHADYICFIGGVSESEAIKLLHNIDLTEESGTL